DATNPQFVTITRDASGGGDLAASWLCDALLRLDNGGAHLVGGHPSCTDGMGNPVYTWTVNRFDLATSNGLTATHSALYSRKDEYVDGTIVNCDQTVTTALIKR